MRLRFAAIFCGLATFANADPSTLVYEMRCDRALEMIVDSLSDRPVWLNEREAAYVEGFLVGFGMLSAIDSPDSSNDAIGKAVGGLVAFCQDAPSRTISELSSHFRR